MCLSVERRHYALITYAIPAARLTHLLPPALEPELVADHALITTVCFRNVRMRWSMMLCPYLTFEQCSYRTYVRYRGSAATYLFGSDLGSIGSYLAHSIFFGTVTPARFQVLRDPHSPLLARKVGYGRYDATIESANGVSLFRLEAFESAAVKNQTALSRFLTEQSYVFLRSATGLLGVRISSHQGFNPWSGRLLGARFDFWERLGLLSRDEARQPVSVLVEPSIRQNLSLPMPARLLTGLRPGTRLAEPRDHGHHLNPRP